MKCDEEGRVRAATKSRCPARKKEGKKRDEVDGERSRERERGERERRG